MRLLRKVQYYNSKKGLLSKLISILIKIRYNRTSQKLGFSIDYSSFGYGLVIPHYGTIVVGGPNKIGNFAVLHTSTCIAGGGKTIGDGLYLSSGSQIIGYLNIGDNVTIASHSLVIHDCKITRFKQELQQPQKNAVSFMVSTRWGYLHKEGRIGKES